MNVQKYRYPILAGTVVAFLAIWQLVDIAVNNPDAMTGPVQTAQTFVQFYTDPVLSSLLWTSIGITLSEILIAFALGTIVGIPVGLLMGRYLVADRLLDPWVNAWYSIPAIAFVPLVMNWAGTTTTSAILVGFLVSVFSIIINVYTGVKNVSKSLVEPALSYGANSTQLFSKVIFPASLPNLMVGLRLGMSGAIIGVIIAEMVFAIIGIGGIIFDAADKLQFGYAYVAILVIAAISIGLTELMKYINRKALPWKESESMRR